MAKTLQIRDVPEETHTTLTARAAQDGRSLSQYLLSILVTVASQPTIDEVLDSRRLDPISLNTKDVVNAVRSGRDK